MGSDVRRRFNFLNGHSHRCRKFLSCVVFGLLFAFIQLFVLSSNPYLIQNTFKSLAYLKFPRNPKPDRVHVLLVSYARTGSSFVGDLLQSLPNTFYHFEPLHFLSSPVLNHSFDEARELLDKIYKCNVTSIGGFVKWQRQQKTYMKFKRSFKYWDACFPKNACYNDTFIDSHCKKHKITVAKTIRLRLKEAAKLFVQYPHLNLKLIYLSRDPRGTLNSRTKLPVSVWCKRDPMCSNQKVFCSALTEDLDTVCALTKERPDDFMVLRYEDLSLEPFTVANRLAQFLGFSSIPFSMKAFLKTHTSVKGNVREKSRAQGIGVPYSTFRNSSITAMSWRQEMSFQRVTEIQDICHDVLTGLGYYSFTTSSSMKSNIKFDINLDRAISSFCDAN